MGEWMQAFWRVVWPWGELRAQRDEALRLLVLSEENWKELWQNYVRASEDLRTAKNKHIEVELELWGRVFSAKFREQGAVRRLNAYLAKHTELEQYVTTRLRMQIEQWVCRQRGAMELAIVAMENIDLVDAPYAKELDHAIDVLRSALPPASAPSSVFWRSEFPGCEARLWEILTGEVRVELVRSAETQTIEPPSTNDAPTSEHADALAAAPFLPAP